jgi:hypothetical protein
MIVAGGLFTLLRLAMEHPKVLYYLVTGAQGILYEVVMGDLDIHIHDSSL